MMPLTEVEALALATKSPPAVVQLWVLKKLKSQVASPALAWMPSPSPAPTPPRAALEVPSPQSFRARCTAIVCAPELVFDMCSVKVTLVMVDPARIDDRSNLMAARRVLSAAVWRVLPT